MKRLIFTIVTATALSAFCRPCPPPQHHAYGPRIRHSPPPPPHHHNCHHDNWWIGPTIVGSAILGSAVINATVAPKTVVVKQPVVTQPVVVQQPIIMRQPVQIWVEGKFIDQVQPNGTIVRVWEAGHYEYR